VIYHSNPQLRPSTPAHRTNHELAKLTEPCKICGARPVASGDDSLGLEWELLGYCQECLNEMFGLPQRRRYHRVPQRLFVRFSIDGRSFFDGLIWDIGLGGAFIQTTADRSSGSTITLVFALLDKGIRSAFLQES